MGAKNSSPVKNNEKFTIKTTAYLVSDKEITPKDQQKAIAYLNGPTFRKRATFDLYSNFIYDKKIKIIINSIKAHNNLKVVIQGTIKVLKPESESKDIVISVLEEALSKYSAQGESMPPRPCHYSIRFKYDETSVVL